jgi:hypothetical protein
MKPASPAQTPQTSESHPVEPTPSHPFRTALFFAASAAFGGIAVALWHRRTLTQLRKELGPASKTIAVSEDADEQ